MTLKNMPKTPKTPKSYIHTYIRNQEELVPNQKYIFTVTGQKYLNKGNIPDDIKNKSIIDVLRKNYERTFTYESPTYKSSSNNDEFLFTPVEKNIKYIKQANLRFIPSENAFVELLTNAILMVEPIKTGGNKYKRKTLRGKRKRRYTRRRR